MTSHPLIRLVSRDELNAYIGAFLDDCAVANLSPRTITYYATNLERFHRWCEMTGAPLDPTLHTKSTVRDFIRYIQTAPVRWNLPNHNMAGKPAGDQTAHTYWRVLHRFYNWLVEDEAIERSPMATMRAPKRRHEQPDPFSVDELQLLVATLEADGDDIMAERNRAIVAVLLDMGLRAAELCGIRVEDIDLTTGDLFIRSGKGNKSRQLRLGARSRRRVRRYWMRYRREIAPSGAFFLGRTFNPMVPETVHDMTTKLGKRAGVQPCNPHRFRHTAAVSAIRAGMREFELQLMLGHTTLEMTRRYVKLVAEDVIRAGQEHSALDHLKLNL